MTFPMLTESKCSVCGFKSEQRVLLSTNTFGGWPDLDTRPAEMKRSSMIYWIQECPNCGYVSESLDDKSDVTQDWLKQEPYISCSGRNFQSNLAKQFYKYYLINVEDKNARDALHAAMCAAWACDDKNDVETANFCRLRALEAIEEIKRNGIEEESFSLMEADLLRRTGQFGLVEQGYTGKKYSKELFNKIIAFQIEKAKQEDTQCYRISDIPEIESE